MPITRKNDITATVSSISAVIKPGSAEYLALSWLLNNDTDTNACGGLDKIRQRYALAVFYFSTNGHNWVNQNSWLTPVNECTWAGVTCSGGAVDSLNMGRYIIANINSYDIIPFYKQFLTRSVLI